MKFLFIISFIIQLLLINAASINNVKVTNDDSTDYLITVPKVLTNEQDKICLVWLNEQTRPSSDNFEVKIKEVGSETLVDKVSAPLTSETICVEIPTKKIRSQRAELEISVDEKVYEKHEVQVRSSVNLVLIETSKPTYYPSEIIKFNIWTVDQLLKPATESFKKVWVENPYGIPMKQWTDVVSKDGVLSFKIKTAEENIFGRWTIKALTKDNHLIVKVFELTRYLDPKINIDVVKPNYLLSSEKKTEVEIKTTDQFHYPIKGQIKVTVGYKPTPFDDPREIIAENMPIQKFEQKIEELTKITLNHTLLQADSIHNSQRYLLVKIEVEQEKTNLTQTLIQELPISQKQVLITLPSSRMGKQYFKPNLPFKSYFSVERPDLSEADNEKMTVCYEMRRKSWIQESKNKICRDYTSNKRGIVEFETEPIKEETEQLLITVHPTQQPNLKNSFVIHPWFTNSYVNFLIKPTIRRDHCLMKHSIEMTLFNVTEKMNAFYQVIGRQAEKPVKFVIDPTRLTKINEKLSKMTIEVESDLLSAIYSPIARVVVFLRDFNKTLVADYDTFEVVCEDKMNEINVSAEPKKESEYEFDVKINSSDDSRCVLQVSKQPYRHQLIQKRIARLMEKMDVNLDFMYHDKCEKQLFINQKKNNNLRNIIPQESIVNFQSSWDVFNKVGLSAISNKDLDQTPCELDLYPEGFSQEMINNFEETKFNLLVQRNYYNNDLVELKKLEQNITEDLIQWINFRKPNEKIVVRNDQVGEEGELHFNAICLSPKSGLQFGHKKLAQNVVQPFKVDIVIPNQVIVDETVYIYVDLHKENTETYPVIVEPIENPNYKLVLESGQKNHFDFVGEHYRIVYVLKAIKPGQTIVKFVVKDGQNGSKYPTKVHTHYFNIVKFGSFVRNTEYQILVNQQNSPKTIELVDTTNQKIRNLSASIDILDILIPKEQKFEKRGQSARDSFSLQYKSPLELVSYLTILSENEKHIQDEQQKELLKAEIERIYQILETKRLPDGSYSAFIGKSAAVPFVDAALTSTIFKLYIQLKQNYLPQISPIALKQTFLFLNKLQSEDGSFKTPAQPIKAFPMNLNKSLDVTSYIVMQFAEAKSDFSSPFMRKSLHFILQKLNSTKDDKENILAKSIVAYLYSLRKNTEKAEKWLSKVDMKNLNELARKENGEQIIAINLLTTINLNKKTEIERLAMWLFNKQQEMNQDQLFSSPLVSQAIVRAWDILNGKDQTVKVNGKTVTRNPLRINENKIVLENKGFIITTFKKEQLRTTENQKDFKITVDGLRRGFKSCAQRSINICYKSKNDKKVIRNPVLNVQIPTGFIVDEWLLSNMLTYGSSSQLDSFDIRQQNLHLLLKPIIDNKSSCIEIPIVQVQKVENRQKYFAQMINYYDYQKELSQKQISQFDTIFFELPKECEIINRALFTLGLRELKKTPQFRQGEEIFDQHHSPLEILNCPENTDDSCPRCLDEIKKTEEKEVCENKFSSLVHRRDLKTEERTLFNKTKGQKRCVVLPMKIHHVISNKNEKLEDKEDVLVYVNEKCRCNYINEKQGHGKAILIKNSINQLNKKQALQLTKDDTLITYSSFQNGEEPSCLKKLNINRRSKRNTEEEKKDMNTEADKEDKNKRSYGYETPKPMPKPVYSQPPVYGQSYSPQPSYAPQSYEAPSMSYESQYQSSGYDSYETPSSYGYEMPPASYNYEAPKHSMSYEAPSYNYGYSKPSYTPMYKAPKPTYSPPPMYQPPKPMYEAPKPSYGQPPMYEAPKPSYAPQMYEAPKPSYAPQMYEAPKPSYGQPQMYEAPKPSYGQPPMYEAPKPSYGQPPMYEAPKPSYGQPPMYEAPKPSYAPQMYEAPKPSYGPPPMYEAPKPSYAPQMYEAPKPSYGQPQMYEAPKPSYGQPPMYEAPKPSYGQPPMYEAPKPSYGQPPMYEAPKPSYGQPPMYEAPSYGQSYGPSSYYEQSSMNYESPSYGYESPSYGYEAPSMSYEAPAPSYGYDYPSKSYSSYKRSVYGMSSSQASPATQPEYNQPQYNAHSSNPGYLTGGYMQSQSYGQQGNYEINLDFYTNQLNNHNKNGAHYKPAPIIIAPIYEPTAYQQKPYQQVSYQPTTYKPASYSSYKRNAAYDLASSASNAYQSYGDMSYGTESYSAPAQSSYSSTSSYSQPQMSYGSTQSYSASAQPSYTTASSYPSAMSSYAAPAQPMSYGQQGYQQTSTYGQQTSYAAPAPQVSYAAPAPQTSYAAPAPQTSYAAPAPQTSYAAPQQMSYSVPAQQMSYSAPTQQMGYSAPAQQMSYSAPAQQMGYSAPAQLGYQQQSSYSQPAQSSYANQQTYAVLYTPVKYATAYVPTYVQTSYSSGYGAVPAYGAASEQKNIVSKVPAKCDKPAKTCPVCEDIASLELLNNICKLDLITTVYKANQTLSARDQAVCGKMNVIENMMKTNDEREYSFNINEKCECPQLRKTNVFANAIVLAPKNKINGKKVQLDENVYVLNDSINMRHEIYNMAKQCNKDNLEDF